MNRYRVLFDKIAWESPITGVRHKLVIDNKIKLRLDMRIIYLYILLAFALAACSPSPAQELDAGNQSFANADYEEAALSYENAMVLDPAQGEPLYNLANTRYRQGIYTDTHTLLPQVAAIGSTELATQSHFNTGNAHYQLQDWEAAVEAYKDALRLNPIDDEAKYNLELAMRNLAQEQSQENQDQQQQDQENQDQQEQEQENQEQDQENQDQENQDQENQDQDQQEQNQQNSQESEEQEQENQEQNQQSGEEEQEQNQQNSQESEEQQSEDQEEPQPAQAQQLQDAQPLTPEQARQLLRAVGQNAETLQEQIQMAIPAEGSPPEKDW